MVLQVEVKTTRKNNLVRYTTDMYGVKNQADAQSKLPRALHVMYASVAKYERTHPLTFREETWDSTVTIETDGKVTETKTIRLKAPEDLYRHVF